MITQEIKDSIDTFCAYLGRNGIDAAIICHHAPSHDMHFMGNIEFGELRRMLAMVEDARDEALVPSDNRTRLL